MAVEVKFELSDADLEHFRGVMHKAQEGAKQISEQEILANAKKISVDIKANVPEFVRERIQKLETFVAMIEDAEWNIPNEERTEVLSALAYFSDPEDLVPDHIPVGYGSYKPSSFLIIDTNMPEDDKIWDIKEDNVIKIFKECFFILKFEKKAKYKVYFSKARLQD